MNETWKDILGYEGIYQVSNLGNVKGVDRYVKYSNDSVKFIKERILKTHTNNVGYSIVSLNYDGRRKTKIVHRLVLEAFAPIDSNTMTVNHIDGIKLNNRLSNLEWCTLSDNIKHSYEKLKRKVVTPTYREL